MGFDLQMCVVPRQVEKIRKKADLDPEYAERIQFLPRTLEDPNADAFYFEKHPVVKESGDDAKELRLFYNYTDADFFSELGRESATLDYLLPRGQTEYEYEIEWAKGNTIVKSPRTKTSATTIFVDEVR